MGGLGRKNGENSWYKLVLTAVFVVLPPHHTTHYTPHTHTSHKAGVDYFKVQSNCPYFVEWKKTPTFSNRNPCSNRVVACSKCNASIWTYNASHHFSQVHPGVEFANLVSPQETQKMKSRK